MAENPYQEFGARPGRSWVYGNTSCNDFFGQELRALLSDPTRETRVQIYSYGLDWSELTELPIGMGAIGPLIPVPRPDGLVTLIGPDLLLVLRGQQLVHGYLKFGPRPLEALHSAGVDGFGTHWIVTNDKFYVCSDPLSQGQPHYAYPYWSDFMMATWSAHLTLIYPGYEYYGWPIPDGQSVASASMKLQVDGLLKCTYYPPLENGMPDTSNPRAVILTHKGPEVTAL